MLVLVAVAVAVAVCAPGRLILTDMPPTCCSCSVSWAVGAVGRIQTGEDVKNDQFDAAYDLSSAEEGRGGGNDSLLLHHATILLGAK